MLKTQVQVAKVKAVAVTVIRDNNNRETFSCVMRIVSFMQSSHFLREISPPRRRISMDYPPNVYVKTSYLNIL